MIFKRCPKCHRRIPSGTTCPDCKRVYSKPEGTRKLYHTKRWTKLREYVLARHNYLDALALEEGKIIPADTVHHITTAKEDLSRFFDPNNLIPVSRGTHDYIHAQYNEDEGARKKMMSALYKIVEESGYDL